MNNIYTIATSYKFIQLNNIEAIQDIIKNLCQKHSILGTILIASEGINFTISAIQDSLDIFLIDLQKVDEFRTLQYKTLTFAEFIPFKKMKIRLKNEIVALKYDNLDMQSTTVGKYLNAKEWDQIISQNNTIIIDTRNSYEFAFGSFRNAINPDTQAFSELPEWFERNINLNEIERPIAMCCTGGIRCEKSTAYVKSLGFKNVYHLQDGILKYFKDTQNEENLWEGNLFVFDDRIALDKNLHPINQNN